MCDYSLMSYTNRLAVLGEELILHRFPGDTRGFASIDDVRLLAVENVAGKKSWWRIWLDWLEEFKGQSRIPAICIPPGANLLLFSIPVKLQDCWGVGPMETVLFVETFRLEDEHRNGLLFGNGVQVSLQCLPCGQRARVLSLSSFDEASLPLTEAYGSPSPI